MSATMKVVLEGLPERIQETADTLDRAFPGAINWHRLAKLGQHHSMRLEGAALTRDAQRPRDPITSPPTRGKAWKLSSSIVPDSGQPNQFCASLRKSFQP